MAQNIGTLQRKLSTLVEELKRARDTWDEINSHAFPSANTLTNLVIQSRYVDETQYWHPLLTLKFPNIIQKYDSKMQYLIEKQNTALVELVEKMAKQYTKMKSYYGELVSIHEHAKKSYGEEFVDRQAVYQTVPLTKYVDRMRIVVDMYKQELCTKRSCVSTKGFVNVMTREEGVVLLSIWINQPNIVKAKLEDWDDICATEMGI